MREMRYLGLSNGLLKAGIAGKWAGKCRAFSIFLETVVPLWCCNQWLHDTLIRVDVVSCNHACYIMLYLPCLPETKALTPASISFWVPLLSCDYFPNLKSSWCPLTLLLTFRSFPYSVCSQSPFLFVILSYSFHILPITFPAQNRCSSSHSSFIVNPLSFLHSQALYNPFLPADLPPFILNSFFKNFFLFYLFSSFSFSSSLQL